MAKRVEPLREGRYNRSRTPEEFKKHSRGASRAPVSLLILQSDYKLLYELGNGRLTYGLQVALRKLREYENG